MGGRGSSGSASGGGGGRAKLPELVGSEKQVSWANDIRETAYKLLDTWETKAKTKSSDGSSWKSINPIYDRTAIKSVREYLNMGFNMEQSKSASWIISNRRKFDGNSIQQMVLTESKTGQISKGMRELKKRKKK